MFRSKHRLKLSQFLYNDANPAVFGWHKHYAGVHFALLRYFDKIAIISH